MYSPASWTSTFWYVLILGTYFGSLFLKYCACENVTHGSLPPGLYLPPPCPESQLYHIPTHKCYSRGDKGPCGNKMIYLEAFPQNKYSQIGACLCENFGKPSNYSTRPLALWPDTQQCYFVYDQGPCPAGKWLVVSRGPKCEQIPCPSEYLAQNVSKSGPPTNDTEFLFSYDGKCYVTLTQGFCPSGKRAIFTNGSYKPRCVSEQENKTQLSQLSSVQKNGLHPCPPGKVFLNNNCESTVKHLK